MKKSSLLLALAVAAGTASAQTPPAKMSGDAMVGSNGMTLYTFDKDEAGSGKSMCVAKCAENWPPLKASDADKGGGDWSVIARDDGSKQWAYKGKPLYYWVKDQKPGDRTGDDFNNVWRVAK